MFHFQLPQQQWQKLLESLLCISLLCHSKLSGIREQWVCPEPSCLRSISASLLKFIHHKPMERMESGTLKRLRTSFSTVLLILLFKGTRLSQEKTNSVQLCHLCSWYKLSDPIKVWKINCEWTKLLCQFSPEKHAYHFQKANDEYIKSPLPPPPKVCYIILLHIW